MQNYIETNSWESYVAGNGTSLQLFDSHSCGGKTLPAVNVSHRPDKQRLTVCGASRT